MTTTVRTDGIVFPDGTLQTTAAAQVPPMYPGVYGSAFRSTPSRLQNAMYVAAEWSNTYYGVTSAILSQSQIIDVGSKWGSHQDRAGSRSNGVTYTNVTAQPRFIVVTTHAGGNYSSIALYVNGQLTANRSGDMDNGGASISAWTIVPPGQTYRAELTVYTNSGGSTMPQPIARWYEFGDWMA